MNNILYSHRLKSVLQQMVCDLGLTLSFDDSRCDLSLAEHEAMLRETAQLVGVNVHFEPHDTGTTVTFYT